VTALLFIPVKVVGCDDPRTQLQTRLTNAVCLQSNLEDETSKNPSKKNENHFRQEKPRLFQNFGVSRRKKIIEILVKR